MANTFTVDPIKELPTAQGSLLDRCAAALSLPQREIEDDTGHVPLMESDKSYKKRLAARLRNMAEVLENGR